MKLKIFLQKLQKEKVSSILYLILLSILFLGILVRLEGFKTGDILFLYDNARDLLYVHKIVDQMDFILIGPSSGGLQGYFHGVFWYYLLAVPYFIGKGSPYVMTFFMVILSSTSILASFLLLKKMMNIWAGIFVTLFFAFSFFSIETSRYIWNPYPIVWIMPFYFFFLYAFVKNKIYSLPILAFLTSLIIHFEAIYGVTLLPLLVVLGILELIKFYKSREKNHIYLIILSLILFMIPILPSVLFDVRHNYLISNSILTAISTGGSNLSHDPKIPLLSPIERIEYRALDLIKYTFGSLTQLSVLNLIYFIVFLVGVYVFFKEKKKENKQFILLCIFLFVAPFLFFVNLKYAVWSYYWIGVAPFFACLAAFLFGNLVNNNEKKYIPIFFAIIFLTICLSIPKLELEKIKKGYVAAGYNNLNTQLNIVNNIIEDNKNEKYSVYVMTPPVYDYVYRYLFIWKNKTQGNPLPDDIKQEKMYVILEPSSSDRNGIFFKENFLKTEEKPVKETSFPGGLKLQKIITSPEEPPIDNNFLPSL